MKTNLVFVLASLFLCSLVIISAAEVTDNSLQEVPADLSVSTPMPATPAVTPAPAVPATPVVTFSPSNADNFQSPIAPVISPASAPASPAVPLIGASKANNQTQTFNVNPGLTPDSPFYFLDDFFERISVGNNPKLAMQYREEKIAEAKVMVEKGKPEEAKKVLEKSLIYGSILERGVFSEMKLQAEESSTKVQEILERLKTQNSGGEWVQVAEEFDKNLAQERKIEIAAEIAPKEDAVRPSKIKKLTPEEENKILLCLEGGKSAVLDYMGEERIVSCSTSSNSFTAGGPTGSIPHASPASLQSIPGGQSAGYDTSALTTTPSTQVAASVPPADLSVSTPMSASPASANPTSSSSVSPAPGPTPVAPVQGDSALSASPPVPAPPIATPPASSNSIPAVPAPPVAPAPTQV